MPDEDLMAEPDEQPAAPVARNDPPFDWAAFRDALSGVIKARGLSDREAAAAAGVAPSTITRTLRREDKAGVDNVTRLVDWAGLPMDSFIRRRTPIHSPVADDVRLHVAAMRASEAAATALRLVVSGEPA